MGSNSYGDLPISPCCGAIAQCMDPPPEGYTKPKLPTAGIAILDKSTGELHIVPHDGATEMIADMVRLFGELLHNGNNDSDESEESDTDDLTESE